MYVILEKKPGTNQWDYPDDLTLFTGGFPHPAQPGKLVAKYSGTKTLGELGLEEYTDPTSLDEYQIENQVITANGSPIQLFAGNYYCDPGAAIQLVCDITSNGSVVSDLTVPVTLKMPLVRHANGQPTQDEIYLNVTITSGVMTATGTLPWSGDWKIIIDRVNNALNRIGAGWKIEAEDITFLA